MNTIKGTHLKQINMAKKGVRENDAPIMADQNNIHALQNDKPIIESLLRRPNSTTSASLTHIVDGIARSQPGLSGFELFEGGYESFNGRLGLVMTAEKTLDLQYYAISDGLTSTILIDALLDAAARGVRVRLLIDDITVGDIRKNLISLEGMEGIEIRVFNPVTTRSQTLPARFIAFFADMSRTAKRMHNKVIIADNIVAITGGRNLGDEYFDAKETAFHDIDILSAGPITADLTKSFDDFWNARETVSINEMHLKRKDIRFHHKIRRKLRQAWKTRKARDKAKERIEAAPRTIKSMLSRELTWAKAEVVADHPEKIGHSEDNIQSKPLAKLIEMVEAAADEFIIISAYFVPEKVGVAWLKKLTQRTMDVRVLTNSLASTDVVAVHSGYRRYRQEVLENGIHIHELKPTQGKRTRQRPFGRSSPSHASLHAKAYIIDGRYSLIGSFNFDPRSVIMNTEIALAIDSADIAQKLRKMYEESCDPENSYALSMDDGKLLWRTLKDKKEVSYRHEPDASPWRILQLWLISLLPVEKHL